MKSFCYMSYFAMSFEIMQARILFHAPYLHRTNELLTNFIIYNIINRIIGNNMFKVPA